MENFSPIKEIQVRVLGLNTVHAAIAEKEMHHAAQEHMNQRD